MSLVSLHSLIELFAPAQLLKSFLPGVQLPVYAHDLVAVFLALVGGGLEKMLLKVRSGQLVEGDLLENFAEQMRLDASRRHQQEQDELGYQFAHKMAVGIAQCSLVVELI